MAVDRSVAPARRIRGDDVADPADDVVDRVSARPLDQAVDREHQLVADLLVEGASELGVVEAGSGRRLVIAGPQIAWESVQQPVRERVGTGVRVTLIEVDQAERAGRVLAAGLVDVLQRQGRGSGESGVAARYC